MNRVPPTEKLVVNMERMAPTHSVRQSMASKEIDTARPSTLRPIAPTADVNLSTNATSSRILHTETEAMETLATKRGGRLSRALMSRAPMRHMSVAPNATNKLNLQRKGTNLASAGARAEVLTDLMVITAIIVTATAMAIIGAVTNQSRMRGARMTMNLAMVASKMATSARKSAMVTITARADIIAVTMMTKRMMMSTRPAITAATAAATDSRWR